MLDAVGGRLDPDTLIGFEQLDDLGHRSRRAQGCCQLDGERDPIESATQRPDRHELVVESGPGPF